jgi:hypothetical protein
MYCRTLFFFIASIAIASLLFFIMPEMLTLKNKVCSKVMVLEGWIPEEGLRQSYDLFVNENYDYIFVTGHQLRPETTLSTNAFLILHYHVEVADESLLGLHTIRVDAESTLGRNDSAHFVLWFNDKEIADFYTSDSRSGFEVLWEGHLSEIDSIMVQFDNDKVSRNQDRNLRINGAQINGKEILFSSPARFIDRGRPFGQSRWDITADTYAALAANYFIGRGIDPNRVISVPNYSNKRRTYGNALALRDWFEKNSSFNVGAINIVSAHYHSRRTWMIYNRLLNNTMEVGIISLDVSHSEKKSIAGHFKTIGREFIAFLYYSIFIIPWI